MTGLGMVPVEDGAATITIAFRSESQDVDLVGDRIGVTQIRSKGTMDNPTIKSASIRLETEWFSPVISKKRHLDPRPQPNPVRSCLNYPDSKYQERGD